MICLHLFFYNFQFFQKNRKNKVQAEIEPGPLAWQSAILSTRPAGIIYSDKYYLISNMIRLVMTSL